MSQTPPEPTAGQAQDDPVVIVGGGHAAAQLCGALAAAGQGSRVHLVCEEAVVPYQRPPLSKAFLKGLDEALQWHRPEAWYTDQGITVHRADPAVTIDRATRRVKLASGKTLTYGWLVLATGAGARTLGGLPSGLDNVGVLRSAADAQALRERLHAASRVTVLGGGFIGLEIAATARTLGKAVTVLESAARLLARSVSPEVAAHVLQVHRTQGIDVRLGVQVGGFEVQGQRLAALAVDGVRQDVDLLVLGIGATPRSRLAQDAGLACDDGIVVDACMRTSDPRVLAMGDCTRFPAPSGGQRLRLESVQNANDQAKTVMATLSGREEPYRALPWFWSEQGALRLQMAGLLPGPEPALHSHRRPGASEASFSMLHYAGERLVCVESVNAPMDHIASRKLLEAGRSPAPEQACDPAVPLKNLA